jgi:Restriction endonuclease
VSIVIEPNWSFEEALEAAWKQYRGTGPQLGVSSRARFLIQWANVVGRERATRELEDGLKRGLLADLSKSTIGRLRKAFRGMPKRAPAQSRGDLLDTLRWIASQKYENETDFLAKAVWPFARALGWADDQLFFQKQLPGHDGRYADAVIATSRTSAPKLLIEVKLDRYAPRTGLLEFMRSMMETSGAEHGVFLAPDELVVFDANGERLFRLREITREASGQIAAMLGGPRRSPQPKDEPEGRLEPEQRPDDKSADGFERLLLAVDSASTNDEKKKSLEQLAAALLSGMPAWRCKYANLVTKSAEIDIVVEQRAAVPYALSEFGRYALVECKNWKKPVDAKHIRDFIGKMRNARVRLGMVFSKRGVTGQQQGTDALREIQQAYAKDQTGVVVISEEDFRACTNPERFLALVDERIDRLRFDL